jgi:hypothetical protein
LAGIAHPVRTRPRRDETNRLGIGRAITDRGYSFRTNSGSFAIFAAIRRACSRWSSSRRAANYRGIVIFDVPDDIADYFELCGNSVCEKIYAHKFVFDNYQQLKLIEPIKTQIVDQVRFICNLFWVNAQVIGNEAAQLFGTQTRLWRGL